MGVWAATPPVDAWTEYQRHMTVSRLLPTDAMAGDLAAGVVPKGG